MFKRNAKKTSVLAGSTSGCINHPGIEAVARCKQCGMPVCGACVVKAHNGNFCSDACQQKHAAFVQRAEAMDRSHRRGTGLFVKLRTLLFKVVVFVAAIGALGFASVYFQIPYAGAFFARLYFYVARFFGGWLLSIL